MNRRGFLRSVGLVALTPIVPLLKVEEKPARAMGGVVKPGTNFTLGNGVDYVFTIMPGLNSLRKDYVVQTIKGHTEG